MATDESSASAAAIAVIEDLIFETKIRATARSLGIAIRTARDARGLSRLLDADPAPLVVVDLSLAEGPAAVTAAATHPCRPTVVAFVSHVQADLAAAGKAAGAHFVLPRSRFSVELEALLRTYVQP